MRDEDNFKMNELLFSGLLFIILGLHPSIFMLDIKDVSLDTCIVARAALRKAHQTVESE